MRQVPHAEIQQTRGARLHAIYAAALDRETVLGQLFDQPCGLVTAAVADEIVERRPARGVQRHRQQKRSTRRENTCEFRQGGIVIVDVFHNVERTDQIEHGIVKRQRAHLPECRVSAARSQFFQGRLADIDKLGKV